VSGRAKDAMQDARAQIITTTTTITTVTTTTNTCDGVRVRGGWWLWVWEVSGGSLGEPRTAAPATATTVTVSAITTTTTTTEEAVFACVVGGGCALWGVSVAVCESNAAYFVDGA